MYSQTEQDRQAYYAVFNRQPWASSAFVRDDLGGLAYIDDLPTPLKEAVALTRSIIINLMHPL